MRSGCTQSFKTIQDVLVKPAGPDCNMACSYCFYLKKQSLFHESSVHRMSDAVLEALVRQVMSQAGEQVVFGWQGGEPTLMGLNFFKRVVGLQQQSGRGQSVGNGLQTNGLLLDDRWAQFLSEYSFLVGLSLDGPQHVHDRYRKNCDGCGTWSTVVEKAKLLQDVGVAVNSLSVVNDYSVRFPEEIYASHKQVGLNHMQFIPCVETDLKNLDSAASFSVSSEAYGTFLCQLFDLWLNDFVDGEPTTFVRLFDSMFYLYVGMDPPDCGLKQTCGDYLVVEHNGNVYPCDFFVDPEWRLGNVLEDDLITLLNGDAQFAFGCAKANLPDGCEICEWIQFCYGGCPKDRIRDPRDKGMNHFCTAYKVFYQHADPHFRQLAEDWKRREAEAQALATRTHLEQAGIKVSRNEPCPCGSGLKFKKCCGSSLPANA
ncbi:MAG: anaerobic sulfatase maturase [Desulfuromusa sp.]|nr:anaerobic sulfatase maturase [Desulfuromusa sp.]